VGHGAGILLGLDLLLSPFGCGLGTDLIVLFYLLRILWFPLTQVCKCFVGPLI
jgi:hypothetical protein